MLGSLAGALAGAYGAAWIVERQSIKKSIVDEVRSTNAAISLTVFILNSSLMMKRQHIRNMVQKYNNHKNIFFDRSNKLGTEEIHFEGDWENLPPTDLPITPLRDLIYNKVDSSSSIITIFSILETIQGHLSDAIQSRNEFIDEIRATAKPLTTKERIEIYFGLKQECGVTDARYPTTLSAISDYVDASIVFASTLAALLVQHGRSEANKLKRKKLRISSFNISAPHKEGLVPDISEYSDTILGSGVDLSIIEQHIN